MRISDWSSDVCSSDLPHELAGDLQLAVRYRSSEERLQVGSPVGQGPDHREVVDALGDVVAGGLAQLLVGGDHVEDVVDHLERHAVAPAELGEPVDVGPRQVAADPIGRASGRERVCRDVKISVGAVSIKNKKKTP